MGGKRPAGGQADLAAVGVTGQDKIDAGGGEWDNCFRVMREGNGEKGVVEILEGFGDIDGRAAITAKTGEVDMMVG